jgi:aminopeptidase YwaD
MIIKRHFASSLFFFLLILGNETGIYGQYPANYTHILLPGSIADEILTASSGELAMQHIGNLAPYTRPRAGNEFPSSFRESNYVISKLKEFGISDYRLDSVGMTSAWRAVEGSVWEVSPGYSKIADITDVPEMLVEGSRNTDLKASLIWVGEGEQSFFTENKAEIKGKIAVTSGPVYLVHSRAMSAGAVGTISFASPRQLIDPVQIPNLSVNPSGFAFMLPPGEGTVLRDRLLRKENIQAEVRVKSAYEKSSLLVPTCLIHGRDSLAGEIILTAHLFEGFVKMGANDNMSGSAVLLEVVHILNDLVSQGRIPVPERNIRVLWVPEFSGTIPWVNRNLTEVKKALCDINLDMVGIKLRENKSFFCLNRSGFANPGFANDVMENCFRYVGESNVEGITDDLGRRGFSRRIVAPTGSDDPFYYRIMSLHGSSDNAVFNNWGVGVPGLKMITWPDSYYHSSEDKPDKCDATQLRRTVFITAAGAYIIASAGYETSLALLGEMYTGAVTRIGIMAGKCSDMIMKADIASLNAVYKRACWDLEGLSSTEKSAFETVKRLSAKKEVSDLIAVMKERADRELKNNLSAIHEIFAARCKNLNLSETAIKLNETEKKAAGIFPSKTAAANMMGHGGERKYISKVPKAFLDSHKYSKLVNADETAGLADGKHSILQIKKIVDSEFERESPLEDIMNFFAVLKEAALISY